MLTHPIPSNPVSPVNKRSCSAGHADTEIADHSAFDDVLIHPFVQDRAVVTLDAGVRLRLARLNVQERNRLVLGPFH